MQDHIFRAYDIRGIVGTELTVENVYDLACALAFYSIEKNPSVKRVAIGMDGRAHSEAIKDEFVRGLTDSGLEVYFIGLCTTPLLYFAHYNLDVQAAVMITASHNPKEYNGFKIMLGRRSLAQTEILRIKHYFLAKKSVKPISKGACIYKPLQTEYITYLKKRFNHLIGSHLPVVFDCNYAAAATVLPDLIKAFEFKNAICLHGKVDGEFGGKNPDPLHQENIQALKRGVKDKDATVGIAFDGDADRMAAMTADGTVIPGDRLLVLLAQPIVEQFPGAPIVFDVKCSDVVELMIKKWGGKPVIAQTGHPFIKAKIRETGALFAGELSCHFFFKDRYFGFDDGVYAALRLIELLQESDKTLGELLLQIPFRMASPELRFACPLHAGPKIVSAVQNYFELQKDNKITTLDGVKVVKEYGWGLLRSSNTESVVSLRLEAFDKKGLDLLRQEFIKALQPAYSNDFLEKTICW